MNSVKQFSFFEEQLQQNDTSIEIPHWLEMAPLESGIYVITNTAHKNFISYIGSTSRTFRVRWIEHWIALSCGTHYNRSLQKDWNKYTANAFAFSVLEVISENPHIRFRREQAWLNIYWQRGPIYNKVWFIPHRKNHYRNDTRIKNLACYPQIITLRQKGLSNGKIARFIHQQKEATNMRLRSLEQAVRRHFIRHSISPKTEIASVMKPEHKNLSLGERRLLSLKCYNEMLSLRRDGITNGKIAHFIHQSEELLNLKPRTIEQSLRRYFIKHPELLH